MNFENVDFEIYSKPLFLPSVLNKGQVLEVSKVINKQLTEINESIKEISEQYADNNNTALINRKGALYGVERKALNNDDYKRLIAIRTILNNNKSTVNDIIKAIKAFYSNEKVVIQPRYPAGIVIYYEGAAPPGIDFNSFMKETVGAGISYATVPVLVFEDAIGINEEINITYYNLDNVLYDGKWEHNGIIIYGAMDSVNNEKSMGVSDTLEYRIINV